MFPRIDFPTLQSKELASLSFLHMDPACIKVNALFIYYFLKIIKEKSVGFCLRYGKKKKKKKITTAKFYFKFFFKN
jgi:hypothetical protein